MVITISQFKMRSLKTHTRFEVVIAKVIKNAYHLSDINFSVLASWRMPFLYYLNLDPVPLVVNRHILPAI